MGIAEKETEAAVIDRNEWLWRMAHLDLGVAAVKST